MKNFNLIKLAIVCASTMIFTMGACASEPAVIDVPDTPVETVIDDVTVDDIQTQDVDVTAPDDVTTPGDGDVIMYPNPVGETGALSSYVAPTIDLMNDEGSTIHIEPDGNGEWFFNVSIYRLCTFNNANGVEMDGGTYLFNIDEDGIEISCQLDKEADGTYSLTIVASNWDLLTEGTNIGNFEIQ